MASARVSVGSDSDSDSDLEMQDDFLGGSDDADDKNNGEEDGSGDGHDGSDEGEDESYDDDNESDDNDDGEENDDDEGGNGEDDDDDSDGGGEGGESYDEDVESDEEGGTGDASTASVSGITDVMAKILENAVPKTKSAILAKGQTDRQIRKRKRQKGKEDTAAEGDKKDGDATSSEDSDDEGRRKRHLLVKKRKEWNDMGRMKPSVLTKEKERRLQKIATRGVVQIFNVVRQQQAMVGEKLSEAGGSVRRRDKVLGNMSKKQFLNLLDHSHTKDKDKSDATMDNGAKSQSDGKWSILRDDYMMKASMKDWDRDDENDNDDDR